MPETEKTPETAKEPLPENSPFFDPESAYAEDINKVVELMKSASGIVNPNKKIHFRIFDLLKVVEQLEITLRHFITRLVEACKAQDAAEIPGLPHKELSEILDLYYHQIKFGKQVFGLIHEHLALRSYIRKELFYRFRTLTGPVLDGSSEEVFKKSSISEINNSLDSFK